ncbi:hypothetical protein JCM10213_004313 [Rhodosporidiobolus nylandii]
MQNASEGSSAGSRPSAKRSDRRWKNKEKKKGKEKAREEDWQHPQEWEQVNYEKESRVAIMMPDYCIEIFDERGLIEEIINRRLDPHWLDWSQVIPLVSDQPMQLAQKLLPRSPPRAKKDSSAPYPLESARHDAAGILRAAAGRLLLYKGAAAPSVVQRLFELSHLIKGGSIIMEEGEVRKIKRKQGYGARAAPLIGNFHLPSFVEPRTDFLNFDQPLKGLLQEKQSKTSTCPDFASSLRWDSDRLPLPAIHTPHEPAAGSSLGFGVEPGHLIEQLFLLSGREIAEQRKARLHHERVWADLPHDFRTGRGCLRPPPPVPAAMEGGGPGRGWQGLSTETPISAPLAPAPKKKVIFGPPPPASSAHSRSTDKDTPSHFSPIDELALPRPDPHPWVPPNPTGTFSPEYSPCTLATLRLGEARSQQQQQAQAAVEGAVLELKAAKREELGRRNVGPAWVDAQVRAETADAVAALRLRATQHHADTLYITPFLLPSLLRARLRPALFPSCRLVLTSTAMQLYEEVLLMPLNQDKGTRLLREKGMRSWEYDLEEGAVLEDGTSIVREGGVEYDVQIRRTRTAPFVPLWTAGVPIPPLAQLLTPVTV